MLKSLKEGRYEMDMSKKLGSGNFADVFRAVDKSTREDVAIKVISMSKVKQYGDKLERAIEKEIYVLRELSKFENPYLLRMIDTFDTANNKYLVLELCNQGTLTEYLAKKQIKLKEADALEYCYQIILGLSALEEAGISHRDLKPENVFMHNGLCKIGDFGFASNESKFTTSLGTCIYMGPEFYLGKGHMNSKVDVWAFGIMMHNLLYGNFPFDGDSQPEVIQSVLNKQYNPPANPRMNAYTVDALRRCLDKDPDSRISFKELRTHKAFEAFIPKTAQRLGPDVQQSFFAPEHINVKINPNVGNVYDQLRKDYERQGMTDPPKPKFQEENLKEKKNDFINKTLVDYRNSYAMYFDLLAQLQTFPDTDIMSFLLVKRTLQRACILFSYLKNEQMPHALILKDVSKVDWANYTQSNIFINFLPYLINDIIKIRAVFEEKLDMINKKYLSFDSSYGKILNDDLDVNFTPAFSVFIKDTISRLIQNQRNVDLCLKFIIVQDIDTKEISSPYIADLREKVDFLIKKDNDSKLQVIRNYLSK